MINWFEKQNKLSWSITIFIAVFIFYMSSKVFEISSYTLNWISIIYHFFVFFFLNFFLLISVLKGKKRYVLFFISFLLTLIYGSLDELHQYFILGRVCTFFDVMIDFLGILFSSIIYFIKINLNKINL
jgi:VanZ family protein